MRIDCFGNGCKLTQADQTLWIYPNSIDQLAVFRLRSRGSESVILVQPVADLLALIDEFQMGRCNGAVLADWLEDHSDCWESRGSVAPVLTLLRANWSEALQWF